MVDQAVGVEQPTGEPEREVLATRQTHLHLKVIMVDRQAKTILVLVVVALAQWVQTLQQFLQVQMEETEPHLVFLVRR